jgi:hypothetical protein
VLVDNGTLTYLGTDLLEHCTSGGRFVMHWYPWEHNFEQDGPNVSGRQAGFGRTDAGEPFWIDNRLTAMMGDHPSGTITAHTRITRRTGIDSCESGPVNFTVHR